MVGRVNKTQMYDRWRYFRYIPDWRSVRLIWRVWRHDGRPQAILQALVDEMASAGITLIDSTRYCTEHLATRGVMTRRQPTEAQWADIRFGFDTCRAISRLDIGQCIAAPRRGWAPPVVVAGCYEPAAVAIATATDSWSRTRPARRRPRVLAQRLVAASAQARRMPSPTAARPMLSLTAPAWAWPRWPASSSQRVCAPTARRPAATRHRRDSAQVSRCPRPRAPTRSAADIR